MIRTEKTLVEVLAVLRSRGYVEDFNLLEVRDAYLKNGQPVDMSFLVIDRIYRFSEQNDVDDEAILYALSNTKEGKKGVFVNGYGPSADLEAHALLEQITVNEDDGEDWLS